MRLNQLTRIVVDGIPVFIIETGLPARDGEERIKFRVIIIESLDRVRDRFGFEQRVGTVRLQVKIGGILFRIVNEYLVHRHVVRTEMFGAIDDLHLRKGFPQPVHNGIGIRIHNNFIHIRDSEKRFDNMLIERLPSKGTVVLARHTLAIMSHGYEGNKFHRM